LPDTGAPTFLDITFIIITIGQARPGDFIFSDKNGTLTDDHRMDGADTGGAHRQWDKPLIS
jgi:hypothetical protein